MARSFAHLHTHTEYSMLDGAARLDPLVAECARLGMSALAMTDHGNVFGAYEFWSKARAHGINPIIGMEGYLAPGSRRERTRATLDGGLTSDDNPGEMYTHMTLLAETTEGMHNLFRLSSLASLEGFYYKPRMDRELLAQYATGIIATTGCPSGEVQRLLQRGRFDAAVHAASDYRDIFGPENFYLELMDHGNDIEARVRGDLLRLGAKLALPPLATNDLHYVHAADAKAHDVLLCAQTKATLDTPGRFRFEGDGYYLKSPAEMRQLWDTEVPGACDNTLRIAERVHVEFTEGRDLMPRFPVPAGETEASWLTCEVQRGLQRRYGVVPEGHRQRAAYELDTIISKGFPGYFLVVADLVRYAKGSSIRVGPGRGSVAGSLVAYVLGITELDPIRHKLMFERFLNPDRPSPPDIDLDFDESRRDEMIRYVAGRYGADRVAQIVTYSTIKAKAAIKDSARALYGPDGYATADRISKAMPRAVMGKDIPLSAIFDQGHSRYAEAAGVRTLYADDQRAKEIIDTARGLENLKRQWGVHAAGVIVSSMPLLDIIPIQRRDADGAIITQFDMNVCETLGLLKMDFLGLRNLTVIDDTLRNIERNGKPAPDLESLALDDEATYQLLARGDTLGVFQLDGGPMRDLLRRLTPTCFEDVSAVLALYRPGPMGANAHLDYADRKNHRKLVKPIHFELADDLADILDETYGLIVYQEQVMAIAQRVAGYSLGQADLLRRAMGKKKRDVLDKEYERFSGGMRVNGYSDDAIQALWELLIPFSDYAFNRAHTAGYGLLAYWTAYLKVHHTAEYMAALLTSMDDDKDRAALYLAECRKMGISVLSPDVNLSERGFTAVGHDIRFGLGGIRDVGDNVIDSIIRARTEQGTYTDFFDFLRKVDAAVCNRKVIESLVKAGAFDSLGHPRQGLHTIHVEAATGARQPKRAQAAGQLSLFDADTLAELDPPIPGREWPVAERLAHERTVLGLYVSDHPLRGAHHILAGKIDTEISAILDDTVATDTEVTVGGILTGISRRVNRRGEPWAVARLEDFAAGVEVLVFAKTCVKVSERLTEDAIVSVRGRVMRRDDRAALVVGDVTVLDATVAVEPDEIEVPAAECTPVRLAELARELSGRPGGARLIVNGADRHRWALRLSG